MGMFKNEFDAVIAKALKRYGLKHNWKPDGVQIMVYLDKAGKDCYSVYLDGKLAEKITLLELLNRKIDFTGTSLTAPIVIQKTIKKLSEQTGIELFAVRIMVMLKNGKVLTYLVNGSKPVKLLSNEEILTDEEMMEVSDQLLKEIQSE